MYTFRYMNKHNTGNMVDGKRGYESTRFMSWTKTVRVESPCHPRLLLALTRKREAESMTAPKMSTFSALNVISRGTYSSEKCIHHGGQEQS